MTAKSKKKKYKIKNSNIARTIYDTINSVQRFVSEQEILWVFLFRNQFEKKIKKLNQYAWPIVL